MKAKRNLIIAIIIVIAVLVCIIICTQIPAFFVNSQKKVFSNATVVKQEDDSSKPYLARYEMSNDEWLEIEKKLSDYKLITSDWDFTRAGTLPLWEDELLSKEELEKVTKIYSLNKYVGVPVIGRSYIQARISAVTTSDKVIVAFVINKPGGRVK